MYLFRLVSSTFYNTINSILIITVIADDFDNQNPSL
jgi:hypothetical protein